MLLSTRTTITVTNWILYDWFACHLQVSNHNVDHDMYECVTFKIKVKTCLLTFWDDACQSQTWRSRSHRTGCFIWTWMICVCTNSFDENVYSKEIASYFMWTTVSTSGGSLVHSTTTYRVSIHVCTSVDKCCHYCCRYIRVGIHTLCTYIHDAHNGAHNNTQHKKWKF